MRPPFDELLTPQQFRVLLRANLATFVRRTFTHLHPSERLYWSWHLNLICSRLEDVFEGKCQRLIINVPPRSLKSITVSVAFVAWLLGHKPTRNVICASYSQDLADMTARDTREIFQSRWYQETFGTRLQGTRPSVSDLRTMHGGGRRATSVGGTLTGLGADILIIDDPLKPEEALSDTEREKANDWFDHTLRSRLNDKRTGSIIVIMQRLHEHDLVGHLIEEGGWEVLCLPAIAEEYITYDYRVLGEATTRRREVGEVLQPDREPLTVLERLRASLGEYHFAGQYQQSPAPLGGGLFKAEWLVLIPWHLWPRQFHWIVQSWDTASKESEMADYSVCTTWGIIGPHKYLLRVRRERMDFPHLKQAVIAEQTAFKADVVLIEDCASGTQLIQELRAMGHMNVKACKPLKDKVMRARAQTPQFEGGFIKLPENAAWLAVYQQELTTFPRGRFDDQVDSTSQALEWLAQNPVEPPLLTFYKELAEKEQRERQTLGLRP